MTTTPSTPPPPECWLRGPVAGVDPALMPAAHALIQTVEDVDAAARDLTVDELWTSPGGAPTLGFHLMHLSGATDRLLTYARGETLNDDQKRALKAEREPPRADAATLLAEVRRTFDAASPRSGRRQPRPCRTRGLSGARRSRRRWSA